MCQYCGCQEIKTIGLLMAEHVEIQNYCGQTRRCVESEDIAGAIDQVRALARVMQIHNAVEERALYLSMTRFEEFEPQAGILYEEHDELDEIIAATLALADQGRPEQIDWRPVLCAFDVLYEHIIREDNGLFPAAAVVLDAADWERCERVREQAERSEQPSASGSG
ncbi:MAG: hemerythrin domain-containing protein [Micrococcales bacterium]|nr:hemerythrin domain-containing protein [Micrococcales bacterium]